MIETDSDYNITYSHGDTLAIRFSLDYSLEEGDVAVFSISQKDRVILYSTIDTPDVSVLDFVISANDMRNLPKGKYQYDLVIKFADGRTYTTNFMKSFNVVGVAHEV